MKLLNILKKVKTRKQGIYFTIEAMIAMMILSVGFGIIIYMFTMLAKPPIGVVQTTLYDTVDLFNTKIDSIGNGSCSLNSTWIDDGNITDTSQSILNQAGEFYYRYSEKNCEYCGELLQQCISEFVDYKNIQEENIKIEIDGQTWYANGTITLENATVIFPNRILLLGTENNTVMWGPYVAKVQVWQ